MVLTPINLHWDPHMTVSATQIVSSSCCITQIPIKRDTALTDQ